MIEYLDMNMPSSSTVTSLYITMDNYTFIVALFNETELVSRQTFDISKYNQESENFVNFSLSFFVLFEKFVVIDMKIIVMVNISQN